MLVADRHPLRRRQRGLGSRRIPSRDDPVDASGLQALLDDAVAAVCRAARRAEWPAGWGHYAHGVRMAASQRPDLLAVTRNGLSLAWTAAWTLGEHGLAAAARHQPVDGALLACDAAFCELFSEGLDAQRLRTQTADGGLPATFERVIGAYWMRHSVGLRRERLTDEWLARLT